MISVELKLLDKTDIKELMEMKANCGGASLSEPKPKTGIVTHCKEYSQRPTGKQPSIPAGGSTLYMLLACMHYFRLL